MTTINQTPSNKIRMIIQLFQSNCCKINITIAKQNHNKIININITVFTINIINTNTYKQLVYDMVAVNRNVPKM